MKANGDPPPKELQSWIDNMPVKLSDQLVGLGLLTNRRVDRGKPILGLIEKYELLIATRKVVKPKHARHQAGRVRLVCVGLKAKKFEDLISDDFLTYLSKRKIAAATRRGYIIVMKDFAKEMATCGYGEENSFAAIKPPGQYENPEYERHPHHLCSS